MNDKAATNTKNCEASGRKYVQKKTFISNVNLVKNEEALGFADGITEDCWNDKTPKEEYKIVITPSRIQLFSINEIFSIDRYSLIGSYRNQSSNYICKIVKGFKNDN